MSDAVVVSVESDDQGSHFVMRDARGVVRVRVLFKTRKDIGIKSDLLARAIGWRRKTSLRVLDATAGLCRDGFHMASLGCEVTALEENAEIFRVVSEQARSYAQHLQLEVLQAEASSYLKSTTKIFDVIFLDPMFPEKSKSAKAGKESELLKRLARPSSPLLEAQLLDLALEKAARVVVKRSPRAPNLSPRKPTSQITGKAVRFDIYLARSAGVKK